MIDCNDAGKRKNTRHIPHLELIIPPGGWPEFCRGCETGVKGGDEREKRGSCKRRRRSRRCGCGGGHDTASGLVVAGGGYLSALRDSGFAFAIPEFTLAGWLDSIIGPTGRRMADREGSKQDSKKAWGVRS
jgi:hypothetical protein